jgi:hypothetical protein
VRLLSTTGVKMASGLAFNSLQYPLKREHLKGRAHQDDPTRGLPKRDPL